MIVFVVDGTVGVTDEDEEVARIIKKADTPAFLVVNKKDNPAREHENLWEYFALGLGDPHPISAVHGHGTGDLLDDIVAALPDTSEQIDEDVVSLAIVGRPNVGKSSLVNKLVGNKRSIVSDVAGTTRDSIDTYMTYKEQRIRLVDTAGMRKKTQITEDIEYYSYVRGLKAIDRAEVCILVVDSSIGVTEQDQKVAALAIERGCGLMLALNKWDLVLGERAREELERSLQRRFSYAPWIPYVRVSALSGRALPKLLDLALAIAHKTKLTLKTSQLNDLLAKIRESGYTPSEKGRRLKIKYATQTAHKPTTLTFWCNAPDLVSDNYEHFLENRIRERFDFEGIPLLLRFKTSTGKNQASTHEQTSPKRASRKQATLGHNTQMHANRTGAVRMRTNPTSAR